MLLPRFENVGTFRGAAEMCGVDPKTVNRIVEAHRRSEMTDQRERRPARNMRWKPALKCVQHRFRRPKQLMCIHINQTAVTPLMGHSFVTVS